MRTSTSSADGTVVVKATPGHTPGHQVLFVRLAKTGPVVLAGDLYHYRDLPMAQHDPHALPTPAIRDAFATFIERERDAAALLDTWIQEEQGILTQMTRSAGTLRE